MRFYVAGLGLCGPGLPDWQSGQAVLAGRVAHAPAPTQPPAIALLPPNERRRAPMIVKLALAVLAEAFAASGRDAQTVPTIFASSGGDGDTIHAIMSTLASAQRELSPTRFHNSVHNAAAGYWSILAGSTAASTSLSCYDDSFAAGLLEAAAQLAAGEAAVGLVAYDVPHPWPLTVARPNVAAFGAAMILAREPQDLHLPSIELTLLHEAGRPTEMARPTLEALRAGTPPARCLPLLRALARAEAAEIMLDYLGDMTILLRTEP